tara:strand:- start:507 stop:869 length:363 start_codon:yes stop_codon:yes gene_type:complete
MRYEQKAAIQDNNKARIYAAKKKQDKHNLLVDKMYKKVEQEINKKAIMKDKKYTQEEAELMADWFNANNQLNTTANISDEIRDLFLQADKIRIKIHQDITDNSNWKFYKKKNNKMGVKYE